MQSLFVLSSGTNDKGVCNMIRTSPSFHSLYLGINLNQHPETYELVVKGHSQKILKSLAFPQDGG